MLVRTDSVSRVLVALPELARALDWPWCEKYASALLASSQIHILGHPATNLSLHERVAAFDHPVVELGRMP